jgi:hypothetical protein
MRLNETFVGNAPWAQSGIHDIQVGRNQAMSEQASPSRLVQNCGKPDALELGRWTVDNCRQFFQFEAARPNLVLFQVGQAVHAPW